jgi:hypothetical protein
MEKHQKIKAKRMLQPALKRPKEFLLFCPSLSFSATKRNKTYLKKYFFMFISFACPK